MNGGANAACTEAKPAPTATLSVAPNPVDYNGRPLLSWSSTNATSCTAPSGNWTNSGTFTAGTTSTVVFNGASGTSQITPGGNAFNNLTIDDANAGGDYTVRLQAAATVGGNLLVTDGTLNYNSQTLTLSGTGKNFTIGTTGILSNAGTTNVSGTITYTDGSTAGNQNLGTAIVN